MVQIQPETLQKMIEITSEKIKKVWIGKFTDIVDNNKEEEFAFRMEVQMDEKMNFIGTVWEEEFYEQTKLFIDVKGYMHEHQIQFVKSYPCVYEMDENFKTIIDYSKKGHQVTYDGKKDKVNDKWTGKWEVKGDLIVIDGESYQQEDYGGYFEMELVEF